MIIIISWICLRAPEKTKKNFSGGVLVGKNTPKVPKVPSTNQF